MKKKGPLKPVEESGAGLAYRCEWWLLWQCNNHATITGRL